MTPEENQTQNSQGWLTWERKIVLFGFSIALLTFPNVVYITYVLWPLDYSLYNRSEIIIMSIRWLPLIAIFLFLMFVMTARIFDTKEAEYPLKGLESYRWKINAKIYQNTVEQCILFLVTYFPLATVISPSKAQILPILTCLWLFGRIFFCIGYHINPVYRAFGFDYTLFSSLLALIWFLKEIFAS